ncbi:MAG TPA: cation:proton antiporter [Candidatus Binatia bacterium]|nr:cation:proton antiporter [Candidatus Binatia bacterium]
MLRRVLRNTFLSPRCLFPLVAGALLLSTPAVAWAAAQEGHQRFGPIFLALALLVLAAKMAGLIAQRWGQPSVLAELLIGIGLANLVPMFMGGDGIAFIKSNPTLRVLAELGVLVLLFDVGLESDLRALVRVGISSTLVALIGVAIPFGLGFGLAIWLLPDASYLTHIFIGATLTATSVGITARVLKDLGATGTREGQIILGAAILDDILGLMILAVVTGIVAAAGGEGGGLSILEIAAIIGKAVLFLGATVFLGHFLSRPIVRLAARTGEHGMILVFGLALCFTLAFVAELIGLADIIGAFAAGLLLDPYGEGIRTREEAATLSELLHPLSSFFVPLFFVLMGIQVYLPSLADPGALGFGVILVLLALIGKLACALGVVQKGVNRLAVGMGMLPRGEVGLIFAGIGASLTLRGEPILSQELFSAVVLMVVITTLIAPIGLRRAFAKQASEKT